MTAIANVSARSFWRWPTMRPRLRLWADGLRVRSQWLRSGPQYAFSATRSEPVQSWLRQDIAAVRAFVTAFEWQFWLVSALSATVMLVLQANVTFWYGGSDHADYLNYAYYLLGHLPPYALPQWRTPGMGIFHILAGTVLLDTWWGLRTLHALMGI